MASVVERHKKTAKHFEQWLSDDKNEQESISRKVEMFDKIADADYDNVKYKKEPEVIKKKAIKKY